MKSIYTCSKALLKRVTGVWLDGIFEYKQPEVSSDLHAYIILESMNIFK